MSNAFDQNEHQKAVDMAWDAIVKAAFFDTAWERCDDSAAFLADVGRKGFVNGEVVA